MNYKIFGKIYANKSWDIYFNTDYTERFHDIENQIEI